MPSGKAVGITCDNSALCPQKHFCPFQMEHIADIMMAGRRENGPGSVVTVGEEFASCSPCDGCLLAVGTLLCSGCCVLWWYVLQRVWLFYTVPFPFWLNDWQCDVFLDISDYPQGERVCACVSDHYLTPIASPSFSTSNSPPGTNVFFFLF